MPIPLVEGRSHTEAAVGARLAVAAIFFVNGVGMGTWASRIPAIQESLALSPGELGLALFGLPVGLVPAVLAAGWVNARVESRRVTVVSALAFCAVLPLIALAPTGIVLALVLVLFGLGSGSLDVAMNTEGAAAEELYGRPIMSGFHGLFSIGGLAGAGLGGIVAGFGIAPLPHFLATALSLIILTLAVARWLPRAPAPTERGPSFARPTWSLAALGVIAFCALLAEGSVADWSAVYLSEILAASAAVAAAGYAAFSLTMALVRLLGDALTHRLGALRLLLLDGALAMVGLLIVLLAKQPIMGVVGFACLGLGLATIFPVLVSAAARDSNAVASSIAAVTMMGYLGFLLGPPMIGLVAQAVTLRVALGLVLVLCSLIVILAPRVGASTPRVVADGEAAHR